MASNAPARNKRDMTNESVKQLCLNLIKADTEDEVIRLLRAAGYWDDENSWRLFGDNNFNYSTIGNQQSRPEASLVEKLTNAIDARLMAECLRRGIDPTGPLAPRSIRLAVEIFFNGAANTTDLARGITIAATGYKPREGSGKPCITISDVGEGQTPDDMPETFLSLKGSIKKRVPFVQGKFNMGGTGILEFCGKHNLQLILTRRDPDLLDKNATEDDQSWGFTVVRRNDPSSARDSSTYVYLAPVDADAEPNMGRVLRFKSDSMPIFHEGNKPYAKTSHHGSLVKMYEYQFTNTSVILRSRPSILSRLEMLLPQASLPIRMHECRSFMGHAGSFDTNMIGLVNRLDQNRGENLEFQPTTAEIRVGGEKLTVSVYAFKKGKAETYRGEEGIIFTVNGQTHGHLTDDFFSRDRVKLGYLKKTLLVVVDATEMSRRAFELLFMPSRDRLRAGALKREIEQELEEILSEHKGLRELRERRRREEVQAKTHIDVSALPRRVYELPSLEGSWP